MDANRGQDPTGQEQGGAGRPPVSPAPLGAPPPPPFPPPYFAMPPQPPPKRGWGRFFGWSFTGLLLSVLMISLILNVYLAIFFAQVTGGPHEVSYIPGQGPQRIVILPIEGMIDDSTAAFVHRALQSLRQRKPAAVILRVDSGGGTVGASDRILKMLGDYQKETATPVVASFGTVAASGGYYVSMSADWIVAEPTCLTGSIGVMSGMFTVEGLMEKIGVTPEVQVAEGSPQKDVANNIFRPWGEADRRTQQRLLDHAYGVFVDVVYEGRQEHFADRAAVAALADGSVYNAGEAREHQLIDEVGYLEEAIAKAKALAGLPASATPNVVMLRPPVQFGVLSLLGASRQEPWPDASQLRRIAAELAVPRLEYR